jgi:hypothetical protein
MSSKLSANIPTHGAAPVTVAGIACALVASPVGA